MKRKTGTKLVIEYKANTNLLKKLGAYTWNGKLVDLPTIVTNEHTYFFRLPNEQEKNAINLMKEENEEVFMITYADDIDANIGRRKNKEMFGVHPNLFRKLKKILKWNDKVTEDMASNFISEYWVEFEAQKNAFEHKGSSIFGNEIFVTWKMAA